ncbi:intraflagellar transport protein 43 homolog A [Aplysia californica]|uniref:Intraflagellar transport protein 43 homolog A n=1 Tax=Aplysia californica TaxID=6500 RepID=A0ABM1ABP8_APLCA|nr:intraflagellar transport protein 43 homolog A [Aplysia californica]
MEDDDFGFGAPQTQKRGAKTGRRAAALAATPAPALEEEELTSVPSTKKNSDGPPDRPTKAVSGWGEEAPARKPRTRQLGEGFETLEDLQKPDSQRPAPRTKQSFFDEDDDDDDNIFRERLKQGSPDRDSDSDNDIPVIPELEEQTEEDLTSKVASAPNVAVNRVATYRELDNDLLKQAAFLTLDNEVDLKLLTKTLSPLDDLIEDDKPWDWDRLFTEVSSELRTEWEKTRPGEEEVEAEQ